LGEGEIRVAIKEKEVWVTYSAKTYRHYEEKGYEFPRYIDKRGRNKYVKQGKILVRVDHLTEGSAIKLTKICDTEGCGKHTLNLRYVDIIKGRKTNKDGLDRCQECSNRERGIQAGIANEETCVATTRPEFAKLFWDVDDAFIYTYSSEKKTNFKCPNCGKKVENKQICYVYRRGISCHFCSDGISYPEKFMYNLLEQLNVDFEFQKTFEWSNRKKYDFYIPSLNVIIETNGGQHTGKGFKSIGGRTLEEEQENDRIKEELALKNKINNYVAIDCSKSEFEWIKNNILNSKLSENKLLDLSKVDFLKCHEFTCSSLVKKACDLWNSGIRNTTEIGKILKLHHSTVSSYLKKGTQLSWCDYDAKEVRKQNGKNAGKKGKKKVVQLTFNGEFIREWESAAEIERELGINNASISSVCLGKRKTVGGYKWEFKTKSN
jgi:hypothetical protein